MAVWKADGVWTFKVTIVDAFGNRKQIRKQKKEWNRKDAQQAERECLTNNSSGSSMPFKKLAEEYFTWALDREVKNNSIRTMKSWYKCNIQPTFENVLIDRINNKMIMAWQGTLLKKDVEDRYIETAQALMKGILEYAKVVGYLSENPFITKIVHFNKTKIEPAKEMRILNVQQFEQFLQVVDRFEDEALYTLLFWGGLRIGEALALQIKDYNSSNGVLKVFKTATSCDDEPTNPKSENSTRNITLNQTARSSLTTLLDTYSNLPDYTSERFLFGYDKELNYTTFNYRHHQYIKKAMISHFKIHSLRHSCVSILIAIGMNPVHIAKRMGHSEDMVLKTYSHLYPDDDVKMAEMQESYRFSHKSGRN